MQQHYQPIQNITEETEADSGTTNKRSDNWLRALEAQSWQAELLISGVIIASLIQLPELFIHWVEGYILESSGMGYTFLNIASMLILAAIDALIVCFGIHFLFRSIWIALLGLNSVYPDGINIESTNSGGKKQWEKAKEKYPNLALYNQELDKQCSLIFSFATVTTIILTSFSVIVLLVYLFFRFLTSLFPFIEAHIVPIGIGLYVVFTVSGLLAQRLQKKYPDNEKIQAKVNKYNVFMGGLFSLYIFEKPIGYITSILTSNSTSKWVGPVIMLFYFFLGFTSATQVEEYPIVRNFGEERYVTFNNRPHQTLDFNYENLRNKEMRIFTPVISADVIQDPILKLFIPIIDREEEAVGLENVSFWEKINRSSATRDSMQREDLKKYAAFNQVFINKKLYSDIEFQYYHHPNAREFGLLSYISSDQFQEGKNILEIRKNYFYQDSIQKIVAIPFYVELK